MELSNEERAALAPGALASDGDGNEVLAGLTLEESGFYMQYRRRRKAGHYPHASDRDRFLQLHERHELARLKRRRSSET
jgi:hypothetical protein